MLVFPLVVLTCEVRPPFVRCDKKGKVGEGASYSAEVIYGGLSRGGRAAGEVGEYGEAERRKGYELGGRGGKANEMDEGDYIESSAGARVLLPGCRNTLLLLRTEVTCLLLDGALPQ